VGILPVLRKRRVLRRTPPYGKEKKYKENALLCRAVSLLGPAFFRLSFLALVHPVALLVFLPTSAWTRIIPTDFR
jgi:hypothetical protein